MQRAWIWIFSGIFLINCSTDPGHDPFGGDATPASRTPEPESPTENSEATPTPPTAFLPLSAEYPLQISEYIFEGEFEGDGAGIVVAGVGDINGDGIDDFTISAMTSDARQTDGGKVYLYFGGTGDWYWHNYAGDAPASFDGEGRLDLAGSSVVGRADLNGDGLQDLIIGAPGHGTGGLDAGRIYGLFGKAEGWYPGQRLATADFILDGQEGDRAGDIASLASGGDLNGDGFDDLVIGCATGRDGLSQPGAVYIVFGSADDWSQTGSLKNRALRIVGIGNEDRFGFSVAIHPDLNDDGLADLVIGAPRVEVNGENSMGSLYLFKGSTTFPTSGEISAAQADFVLQGEVPGGELGSGLGALGDVNGDGRADLGVGAWGNTSDELTTSRGRFYIITAGSAAWPGATMESISERIIGDAPYDYVGRPVVDAGDVNGDGHGDMLFGSYLRDYPFNNSGNSYLFYGGPKALSTMDDHSLQEADVRFLGEREWDYSGFSVSGVGDVNGDGLDDILIGALGYDGASTLDIGRAYLILGRLYYTD